MFWKSTMAAVAVLALAPVAQAAVPVYTTPGTANAATYNSVRAEFPPVTGAQVTVTHMGIVEGDSAGDATATLMYSEPLPAPRTLQINDVFVVDSQTLTGDFTLALL